MVKNKKDKGVKRPLTKSNEADSEIRSEKAKKSKVTETSKSQGRSRQRSLGEPLPKQTKQSVTRSMI